MGYSKSFYFPWLDLEGDDPGDTLLADLDNKNQQPPDANLTQDLFGKVYPSAPKITRMHRYPTGRNMPEAPTMPGVAGGMIQPYDMGGFPVTEYSALSPAAQIGTLTSILANTAPAQHSLILGENLYPLVEQLEPNQGVKVTVMLLEMDQTDVLHLLESPEALKSKVAEAMDVPQ